MGCITSLVAQLFQLNLLIKTVDPSVLCAFDYVALLRVAIWRCFHYRKTIFVKAGGTTPQYLFPPVEEGIVFSQELINGFSGHMSSSSTSMNLILARIDRDFFADAPYPALSNITECVLCMRLTPTKKTWLNSLFSSLEASADVPLHLNIIGGGALESFYREWADRINLKNGHEIITLLGEINNREIIRDYYCKAAVTIGHGRGILEAMSCGRPVIILGASGGAEWVTADNQEKIKAFNFSGRHLISDNGIRVPELLQNADYEILKSLGEWSKEYIKNNYDLSLGGKQMDEVCSRDSQKQKKIMFVKWLLRERH